MRLLLLLSFALLSVFILVSCKDHYQVIGVSDNTMLDGSRVFLKKEVDNRWVVVDSCEVLHGKFKMKGVLDSVFVTSLFVDDVAVTPFVLEEGKTEVLISRRKITVEGTELNDELQLFIDKHEMICDRIEEFFAYESRLVLEGYAFDEAARQIQDSIKGAVRKMELYGEKFVKQHYDNPLGPFVFSLLCNILPDAQSSPSIERIIKDAPDAFRCDPYVREFIVKGF